LAFEPSRELAQWINEFSIEVLDAPFNFALVLSIRWMSKLSLNAMFTAAIWLEMEPATLLALRIITELTLTSMEKSLFISSLWLILRAGCVWD